MPNEQKGAGLTDSLAKFTQGVSSKARSLVKTSPSKQLDAAKQKLEAQATEAALKQAGLSKEQSAVAKTVLAESGGTTNTMKSISDFFKVTLPLFFVTYRMPLLITAGVVIAFIVVYILYRNYSKPSTAAQTTKSDSIASALNATVSNSKKEGFQTVEAGSAPPAAPAAPTPRLAPPANAPPEDLSLLNLQPLTIKQAGFLGPLPDGSFDAENATTQALRAGFRSLVLQIDSLDIQKDNFEEPGFPTLLYRDGTGGLVSTNSGSIEAVANAIANTAFRPEVPNFSTPIILYLHIVRTPSPVREQRQYIRFLSRIAKALQPLAPMHLGMTPIGNFHRQNLESQLLLTPLRAIEGKVILLTNADTSIFRTPPSETERYDPKDDLDFWVNMRVYLDSEDENFGVAKTPERGSSANAVIVPFSRVLALTGQRADNFASKGKSRFVIAMTDPMQNPGDRDIDKALNDLGVNMIPIDIFSGNLDDTKKILDAYGNKTWRQKPLALRKVAST
jgi:hypothetical protein